MELAEARNRYDIVAVLCQKSILRTAVSGVPGVELDIKTFLKTYMNNICGTKKSFFLAEASYEEIWRVEVMDFYENVQFLIRRRPQGARKAKTAMLQFYVKNSALGRQVPGHQWSYWSLKCV